jgi:hypothetical protein
MLCVFPSCDDSLEFSNTPPGSLAIEKDKCYLGPLDSVVLTGTAEDPDGDEISFTWTAEAGTLTPADGKGPVVTWRAPDSHGTYRVVMKVTDELDTSSKSIDLDVGRNLTDLHEGEVLDQTDYPYVVPNALPLNISALTSITIEAGVIVVFNEGTGGLNVGGTLVINGTEADRVLLTPNICPGEDRVWKGITFSGGSASGTLNYVTITSTADGLAAKQGASITGNEVIIDQSSSDALTVESGATVSFQGARLWDNGGGVYVANGTLDLTGSSVRYNANYGFSLLDNGGLMDVDITGCVIANNNQFGIVLAFEASPVINNCSLFLNGPTTTDIRTVQFFNNYTNADPVDMTGNYWGADTEMEIMMQIVRLGANGSVNFTGWLTDPPVSD